MLALSPFPELALPRGHLGPAARGPRADAVEEARSLPGGTLEEKVFHPFYSFDGWEVGVQKPGKEADPARALRTRPLRVNPDDMLPTIRRDGALVDFAPGFQALWEQVEDFGRGRQTSTIELLGSLFFRAAFMLDHEETATGTGLWRYRPSPAVVEDIERWTPMAGTLPVLVFLYYVDLLALNEDVKYRLHPGWPQGVGRPNNLATCARVAAVLLGRTRFTSMAGDMARQPIGVAPIGQDEARELFPLLAGRRP